MTPLAERMRPRTLEEFFGQDALVGHGGLLRLALDAGQLGSLLFWGPPGVGKTTLARLLAAASGRELQVLSAVQCGVKDLRAAVTALPASPPGILFLDEVHRFNKAQQDALLPSVESGRIVFIGASTENPAFSINRALLSRLQVLQLFALGDDELARVLQQALNDQRGLQGRYQLTPAARVRLIALADGDARRALGLLEQVAAAQPPGELDQAAVDRAVRAQPRAFDKGGDQFYELISALHKSVRGSDPDAALYYLARMLDGGGDPYYIARRLIRMASEDIGNADPRILGFCVDAADAYARLGSPEGDLALAQAAVYLACAPKSNAVYSAFNAAMADVRSSGSLPVPAKLRNAATGLQSRLGHGKGYRYAHDEAGGIAWGETYLPDALGQRHYYQPTDRGLERGIGEKLATIRSAQKEAGR